MRWLKWTFAYLFDCVHPHTSWPHSGQTGLAYVCCLDCGKELPYSLELMRIVNPDTPTEHELRNSVSDRWRANTSLRLAALLLLLYPSGATGEISDSLALPAPQEPGIVSRFVGSRAYRDRLRQPKVHLCRGASRKSMETGE